jgi:hypothetical protein
MYQTPLGGSVARQRGIRKRGSSQGQLEAKPADDRRTVERIQTGVRLERRLLSVLKALADLHKMSLGDLLEGIVLHALEGKPPFSEESLKKVESLKAVFGLDLGAADSHLLTEQRASQAQRRPKSGKEDKT